MRFSSEKLAFSFFEGGNCESEMSPGNKKERVQKINTDYFHFLNTKSLYPSSTGSIHFRYSHLNCALNLHKFFKLCLYVTIVSCNRFQ